MAFRLVPAGHKQWLDVADEIFDGELDDDVWDEVISQIESQQSLNQIANADIEIEQRLCSGNASTGQGSMRHARAPEHTRAGIPDLEDMVDDIGRLQQTLSAQTSGHKSDITSDIEGMFFSRKKDETSSTSLLREQETTRNEGTAGGSEAILASLADHASDVSSDSDTTKSRQPESDSRSPLERFRSPPRKTLSVTDLVSPAWCELQYWYSLTKFGRVRQTPIMKQGTKIHKEKEREVQTEVIVTTESSEDRFGIKLWNMIAGLRAFRAKGLTRELPVIGMIDGEIINGVIDELTETCPDEGAEATIYRAAEALSGGIAPPTKKRKGKKPSASEELTTQRTLSEFFANPATIDNTDGSESPSGFGSTADDRKSIYLVDIKTRKAKGLPGATQMRPTRMQLMLYHRLLTEIANGEVDPDQVFQRYRLDKDSDFSKTFIDEMSKIDAAITYEDDDVSPDDRRIEIEEHNTLSKVWTLMISEFSNTLTTGRLSPLLSVEYRASNSGEVVGNHSFALDAVELNSYVASEMQWWRGERPARGVEITEASKCSICEFAESCSWRKAKIAQAAATVRSRKAATAATRSNSAPTIP